MFDWRHKKNNTADETEDFILTKEDSDTGNPKAETDNASFEDTCEIPAVAFKEDASGSDEYATPEEFVRQNALDAFDMQADTEAADDNRINYDIGDDDGFKPASTEDERSFFQKYRSAILAGGITVAAGVVIAALIIVISIFSNPLRNYNQMAVTKGNVVNSMNTDGTLSANARYSITSLVSGTVKESTPEVGDKVKAGTVLYKLDDSEAQLAVKRAENQLARSKSAGTASSTVGTSKIYSTESGTVQTLNIKTGYKLSAGQVVGTVQKADGSVSAITTPISGTVMSVNSAVGKSISAGALVAILSDNTAASSSTGTHTYDQKSNEYDVESAKNQLENYTIKSPVDGIVTEKNTKVGDNVGITNLDKPMMVIVDMNSLKFTFSVDEYRIWDMEVGQDVIVNTESLPDESFAAKITAVSNEGYQNDEGKTVFDIEVTVDEPGNLKSGMNVTAKVIMQSATNVMYLPKEALIESDGTHALVLVKENSSASDDLVQSEVPREATDEELAFPTVKIPKGCKLITVSYGISDDTNVEILSGIKVGDIVVYSKDATAENFKSATADKSDESENAEADDDNSAMPDATEAKKNELDV